MQRTQNLSGRLRHLRWNGKSSDFDMKQLELKPRRQIIRWKNDKSRSISRTLERQKEKAASNQQEHLFGLRPVDFSILPPLYAPPPPPPPRPGFQRLVFPLTILTVLGTVGYFYFNNQNDSYEYWEAMQTGGVLPGTYDDDDDDDDDDDNFDDEEE